MKIIIDTRGALKVVLNGFKVLGRFKSIQEALDYCDMFTYYDEDLGRYLTYTQNLRKVRGVDWGQPGGDRSIVLESRIIHSQQSKGTLR